MRIIPPAVRTARTGRRLRLQVLKEIRDPNCVQCDLGRGSQVVNHCVMGRGNVMASIMLVGEAPGETESRTGQPFMGAAGQTLQKWLNELGMANEIYITNVCKCRPDNNRKPHPREIIVCYFAYLIKELEVIKPKVIVCLGRTAIDWAFGKQPFKRGEPTTNWFIGSDNYTVIPTWHPSYFLRCGGESSKAGREIRDDVVKCLYRAKELSNRR